MNSVLFFSFLGKATRLQKYKIQIRQIDFFLHISHRLYKGPTFNFVLSTLIFNFVVPEFKSYGLRQFLPSLTGLFSSILGLDPTVPSFEV